MSNQRDNQEEKTTGSDDISRKSVPDSERGHSILGKRTLPSSLKDLSGICFVGPMIGRNPGLVTTQGEVMSDLFAREVNSVISVSSNPNRYMRLFDIAWTLFDRRKEIEIQCLSVYGGPSFVVEDIASRLGRMLGQRIVMQLHGGALPHFMSRFPDWTRRVLSRADIIVAPSDYLAKAVGAHGFHVTVIPNVIDLEGYPFRLRQKVSPRLFWMRSFHPIYNPLMCLRVLARLRAVYPDAQLVMTGQEKGSLNEVRREGERLGLTKALSLPGFVDMAGKVRYGAETDIFINTSHIDNMPVALIEACAMGMPVVTTNVGGIPHMLRHEETCLMVEDNDDEAMAAAIVRLVSEPGLAARLSANGRSRAEEFSWGKIRLLWEAVFSELKCMNSFERRGRH